MNYIHITKENLDKEHICCAMSGKQSLAKKEWLRQRFDEEITAYLLALKWWDWDADKIFRNMEALCSGDLTKIRSIKD